jgi:hypothetical protein
VTSLPGKVAVEENENKRALKYTEEDIKKYEEDGISALLRGEGIPSFFPSMFTSSKLPAERTVAFPLPV